MKEAEEIIYDLKIQLLARCTRATTEHLYKYSHIRSRNSELQFLIAIANICENYTHSCVKYNTNNLLSIHTPNEQ